MSDIEEEQKKEREVANPFEKDAAEKEEEKQKKPRANVISLKPDDLC
jgi:hypothetical protein